MRDKGVLSDRLELRGGTTHGLFRDSTIAGVFVICHRTSTFKFWNCLLRSTDSFLMKSAILAATKASRSFDSAIDSQPSGDDAVSEHYIKPRGVQEHLGVFGCFNAFSIRLNTQPVSPQDRQVNHGYKLIGADNLLRPAHSQNPRSGDAGFHFCSPSRGEREAARRLITKRAHL